MTVCPTLTQFRCSSVLELISCNNQTAHTAEVSSLLQRCAHNSFCHNISTEMAVDFCRNKTELQLSLINNQIAETAGSFKFQGTIFSSSLKWNMNVAEALLWGKK